MVDLIESVLENEELRVLIETAEPTGSIRQADLTEFLELHPLEPLEVDALYRELDQRGIEVVEGDKDRELAPPPVPVQQLSYETTTDALQLFLREAGRHALLTAPQEAELAKARDRGGSRRRSTPRPAPRPASTSRSETRKTRSSATSWPATGRCPRTRSRSRSAARRSQRRSPHCRTASGASLSFVTGCTTPSRRRSRRSGGGSASRASACARSNSTRSGAWRRCARCRPSRRSVEPEHRAVEERAGLRAELREDELVRVVQPRRPSRAMPVGGDNRRQPVPEEAPAELLALGPVPAQEARRVHLQRPAALRELGRERRSREDRLRPLRVGHERRQPRRLGVLAEREQEVGRPCERHLHQDDVEPLHGVAARIDVEQVGDRRELPAQADVDPGQLAQLLDPLRDARFASLVGRQERRDVRRREEDARSVARRRLAERDPLVHGLGAVVTRGDDVAVDVDEPTRD